MYNPELFERMVNKFGIEKTTEFAEMISHMYDLLHKDAVHTFKNKESEYGYEHYWWQKKHEELKSAKQ